MFKHKNVLSDVTSSLESSSGFKVLAYCLSISNIYFQTVYMYPGAV